MCSAAPAISSGVAGRLLVTDTFFTSGRTGAASTGRTASVGSSFVHMDFPAQAATIARASTKLSRFIPVPYARGGPFLTDCMANPDSCGTPIGLSLEHDHHVRRRHEVLRP